jgi:hypothetical protein
LKIIFSFRKLSENDLGELYAVYLGEFFKGLHMNVFVQLIPIFYKLL